MMVLQETDLRLLESEIAGLKSTVERGGLEFEKKRRKRGANIHTDLLKRYVDIVPHIRRSLTARSACETCVLCPFSSKKQRRGNGRYDIVEGNGVECRSGQTIATYSHGFLSLRTRYFTPSLQSYADFLAEI